MKNKKTAGAKPSKPFNLKNIKSGDEFAYKNIGYGLVSYERGGGDERVWRTKGRLYTDTFSSIGMEWDGTTWVFDGGLGMTTKIVRLEDVPLGLLDEKTR
jgi:hypothetical protein